MKKTLIFVVMVAVLLLSGCITETKSPIEQIENYAKTYEFFPMGDALDFQWDVAYIDRQLYAQATDLKEKYGLEFDIETQDVDHMHRILFFKDGILIKKPLFEYIKIEIPEEIEVIYPDTDVGAKWRTETVEQLEYEVLKLEFSGRVNQSEI